MFCNFGFPQNLIYTVIVPITVTTNAPVPESNAPQLPEVSELEDPRN